MRQALLMVMHLAGVLACCRCDSVPAATQPSAIIAWYTVDHTRKSSRAAMLQQQEYCSGYITGVTDKPHSAVPWLLVLQLPHSWGEAFV